MPDHEPVQFSSKFPVIVLSRPANEPGLDWQEVDRGPGYFTVPAGHEIRVRIKGINDRDLYELVEELQDVKELRFLDLSENRNVTNDGLARLKALPQLTGLNLSSCTITNYGITHLRELPRLETLILIYCNRLTDESLKTFESMRSLKYLDLQGCLHFTKGGLARVRRRDLQINR